MHRYDDMMELPYQKSTRHPQMTMLDRAAQFSPFAALTGLDATMDEAARRTEERIELDEEAKELLDEKWREIVAKSGAAPKVRIRYFQPDDRKLGGSYVTVEGTVHKVDEYGKELWLENGLIIAMEDILELDSLEQ